MATPMETEFISRRRHHTLSPLYQPLPLQAKLSRKRTLSQASEASIPIPKRARKNLPEYSSNTVTFINLQTKALVVVDRKRLDAFSKANTGGDIGKPLCFSSLYALRQELSPRTCQKTNPGPTDGDSQPSNSAQPSPKLHRSVNQPEPTPIGGKSEAPTTDSAPSMEEGEGVGVNLVSMIKEEVGGVFMDWITSSEMSGGSWFPTVGGGGRRYWVEKLLGVGTPANPVVMPDGGHGHASLATVPISQFSHGPMVSGLGNTTDFALETNQTSVIGEEVLLNAGNDEFGTQEGVSHGIEDWHTTEFLPLHASPKSFVKGEGTGSSLSTHGSYHSTNSAATIRGSTDTSGFIISSCLILHYFYHTSLSSSIAYPHMHPHLHDIFYFLIWLASIKNFLGSQPLVNYTSAVFFCSTGLSFSIIFPPYAMGVFLSTIGGTLKDLKKSHTTSKALTWEQKVGQRLLLTHAMASGSFSFTEATSSRNPRNPSFRCGFDRGFRSPLWQAGFSPGSEFDDDSDAESLTSISSISTPSRSSPPLKRKRELTEMFKVDNKRYKITNSDPPRTRKRSQAETEILYTPPIAKKPKLEGNRYAGSHVRELRNARNEEVRKEYSKGKEKQRRKAIKAQGRRRN